MTWVIVWAVNLRLDASAKNVRGQPQRTGKANRVDVQNLWIQEASKSGRFSTKTVDTSVNPSDLMTKSSPKPKIEQLMKFVNENWGTC